MNDEITIRGLKLRAFHGVHDHEKTKGQVFLVDAFIRAPFDAAAAGDDLGDTVSYSEVCSAISDEFLRESCDLIETAASRVADRIMRDFPSVLSVKVVVHKPEAPVRAEFDDISVSVTRRREAPKTEHTAYLGLGANIGDRQASLDCAVAALGLLPGTRVDAVSSVYETEPVGYADQPDFLNMCVRVVTTLSPRALLGAALGIEAAMGRIREFKNGPRVIDIDLLLYDNAVMNSAELTLPHPRMYERAFVMGPLSEIKE